MENGGQQQTFSFWSEKNIINSESSIFNITGEEQYTTALKLKRSSSSEVIVEGEGDSSDDSHSWAHPSSPVHYDSDESCRSYFTARNEMEEEDDDEDNVYVAVGKGQSSMDALFWMLTNLINPSTKIYLIHIYPETRYIPSPLGLLPKRKVSAKIVDNHINQEREKAKAFLQKYLVACTSSFNIQNKVDAVLIESNCVEKTLLKLIPFLKINKLVLGTPAAKTNSSMAMLRKNGIAHKIFINAPRTCDVKLVCEGKQVMDPIFATPTLTPASSRRVDSGTSLSSPSSSWRSNSTGLSWFKKSRSAHDLQKSEVKLDKSKSYPNLQLSKNNLDKAQCVCFHPTHVFAGTRG